MNKNIEMQMVLGIPFILEKQKHYMNKQQVGTLLSTAGVL